MSPAALNAALVRGSASAAISGRTAAAFAVGKTNSSAIASG
jgi:hypothetical protein